jgi:Holliday junction resolvasome RuvABC endonuclease subunit
MKVFGVDPGAGVKSPTAVTAFEPIKDYLIGGSLITPGDFEKETDRKMKFMADSFAREINQMEISKGDLICFESFVMRGKGGETLQRLIGAFLSKVPYNVEIMHVQNTAVKKHVGGSGKASKLEVAEGLLEFFKADKYMKQTLTKHIDQRNWDFLDALAIGVTGYQMKIGRW